MGGYFFVDRILSAAEDGSGSIRASGIKAVSRADPYLRPSPEGRIELSASFLAEAVGQLAAWITMSRAGFLRRPVAGLTAEAIVRGAARPGDLVSLEVEIESLDEEAVHYHGRARVRGETALELRDAVGPLLAMEDFDDPRAAEREYRRLARPLEASGPGRGAAPGDGLELDSMADRGSSDRGFTAGGEAARPLSTGGVHPAIDGIIERGEDRILALTCVSRSAPYLEGHFPRDPVLPATLLFDAQVSLAAELLAAAGAERSAPPPRLARLSDLKMRGWVRPGSRLVSEVKILRREGDRTLVQLAGRLGSRTVSSGVAEFQEGRGLPGTMGGMHGR